MTVRAARPAVTLVALVSLAACSTPGPPEPTPPAPAARAGVRLPPPAGQADYQIGGAYTPAAGTAIVVRDRTELPPPGLYGVCYVNAFQTQPDERGDHPELHLRVAGREVIDPDYPDETLYDVGSPAARSALAMVVGPWIDGCAADGYDAVELDNLDSPTRSEGALTAQDAEAFAALVIERAHRLGLAVAQKNAAERAAGARTRVGFDFAIAEECGVFGECDAYTAEYGARVLEVEYTDNGVAAYEQACRDRPGSLSIQLRDRDLVPAGRPGHVARTC